MGGYPFDINGCSSQRSKDAASRKIIVTQRTISTVSFFGLGDRTAPVFLLLSSATVLSRSKPIPEIIHLNPPPKGAADCPLIYGRFPGM
jgi:hypothetical protein